MTMTKLQRVRRVAEAVEQLLLRILVADVLLPLWRVVLRPALITMALASGPMSSSITFL